MQSFFLTMLCLVPLLWTFSIYTRILLPSVVYRTVAVTDDHKYLFISTVCAWIAHLTFLIMLLQSIIRRFGPRTD
jgi:hypothetical protein